MAAVLRNAARERLDAGELALGVILRQARTVDIAPIMQAAGYDWLFLDLEHNSMDLDTAVQISVAALGVGIAPVARVPAGQLWMATRLLDGGALGMAGPHVDTPEGAQKIAQALRSPPQGHRSVAGGLPHLGYAKHGLAETCAAINAATLIVVMLETPTAIANADAIAAVSGIDCLLIGTNDLAMELGIPGRFADERIAAAYRTEIDACRPPEVQIGRSLLMLVSNMIFVVAISRVPLATASAIGFTSPLIVTALSVPLLHESVGIRRWSAVVVGFAGALLVIRPGAGLHDPAVLLLLLSSAAYALYQIATRWLGLYDDAAVGIVFSALLGSLVMTAVLPFVFVMPQSTLDFLLFCSLGLLGGAGHYLVIRAFQYGPAAVIAPLGYVELIGTTILGYAIFGNFPDAWTWLGAAIIIASGVYIAFRERRRRAAAG